jgi:hypothetical protein
MIALTYNTKNRIQNNFLSNIGKNPLCFSYFPNRNSSHSPFLDIILKIREASNIIQQIQKTDLRRGPLPPDTPNNSSMQCFYLCKQMFDTSTHFGFFSVLFLLNISQFCNICYSPGINSFKMLMLGICTMYYLLSSIKLNF